MRNATGRHVLLGMALGLAAVFTATTGVAAETSRPNILFVFADDWGRFASIYAAVDGGGSFNDVVRTPHFDRLARRGVL